MAFLFRVFLGGFTQKIHAVAPRLPAPRRRAQNLLELHHERGRHLYPAASLQRWGLTHHKYKGSDNRAEREGLIAALLRAAPWLELGAYADLCARSDDALDAVVAALTARAAALGLTSTPADGHQRDLAQREGWIALPEAPLSALIGPT